MADTIFDILYRYIKPEDELFRCRDCGKWCRREELNHLGYCGACTQQDLNEEEWTDG